MYETFSDAQKEKYRQTLKSLAALSNLFASSQIPFLDYRVAENVFCESFDAQNLARYCNSADAMINGVGVGIKTWVKGTNRQKVAEFDKAKSSYEGLSGLDLAKRIAELRNERIETTMGQFGLKQMLYHCILRFEGSVKIIECSFDKIDIENIKVITTAGNKDKSSLYFTDSKSQYSFMYSKSTLFKVFDSFEVVDQFDVDIIDKPYPLIIDFFEKYFNQGYQTLQPKVINPVLYLPLFSINKGQKFVPPKSGLNQWHARGRIRHMDEVYIPYNKGDRDRSEGFFPASDSKFELELPDKTVIMAKVCQESGKAIMSDPNKDLGNWILRRVLHVKEGELLTYEKLVAIGIDCVCFEKINSNYYKLNFGLIGDYEAHFDDWYNGKFLSEKYEIVISENNSSNT